MFPAARVLSKSHDLLSFGFSKLLPHHNLEPGALGTVLTPMKGGDNPKPIPWDTPRLKYQHQALP